MKTAKKLLAVLIAALMTLSVLPVFAATAEDDALRFNAGGKFKIMLFADPQDDEDLEETTAQLMCEALDKVRPDLVIFLGDNTVADGYEKQAQAIEAVTKPVRDRNVPYAIVFGNHDQEHNVSKEELLEIYRGLGCLTYDADPDIYGCGTCNLPIYASDGSGVAFNLWLIDSGSNNTDEGAFGYDYVHPDQIEWYKKTAAALAAENGGKPVPALDFQHIVIPEIFDALYPKLPVSLGKATQEMAGGTYSLIPVFTRLNGYWLEQCCPPAVYDGQLDAWKEVGDVMAEFHGHDHVNSYHINVEGVDIVNVPTVGCNSYSKDINRGVGVITLDEKDLSGYEYELLNIYELALEKNSKISEVDGGKSRAHYSFMKLLDAMVSAMFKVFNLFNRRYLPVYAK